jgi:hypothetical protein
MPQENKELVRRWFEALSRHDVALRTTWPNPLTRRNGTPFTVLWGGRGASDVRCGEAAGGWNRDCYAPPLVHAVITNRPQRVTLISISSSSSLGFVLLACRPVRAH